MLAAAEAAERTLLVAGEYGGGCGKAAPRNMLMQLAKSSLLLPTLLLLKPLLLLLLTSQMATLGLPGQVQTGSKD